MAVQVVPGLKPVTVKTAGVVSEALVEAGETLLPAQARLTVTEAELLSEKSLWTVKVAELRVLVMVQLPPVRAALQAPLEV